MVLIGVVHSLPGSIPILRATLKSDAERARRAAPHNLFFLRKGLA
jgi:hypothetical protein